MKRNANYKNIILVITAVALMIVMVFGVAYTIDTVVAEPQEVLSITTGVQDPFYPKQHENVQYVLSVPSLEGRLTANGDGVHATLFAPYTTRESGWYDQDKVFSTVEGQPNDSELCWAASDANVIAWYLRVMQEQGKNVSMYDTELLSIFEKFRYNWAREGYDPLMGLSWYFTGKFPTGAPPDNLVHKNSGGYLKSIEGNNAEGWFNLYPANDKFVFGNYAQKIPFAQNTDGHYYDGDPLYSHESFSRNIIEQLHYGAVVLTINKENGGSGSHAVTLWGCDYDMNTGLVTKLYLTDSDDRTKAMREVNVTARPGDTGGIKIDMPPGLSYGDPSPYTRVTAATVLYAPGVASLNKRTDYVGVNAEIINVRYELGVGTIVDAKKINGEQLEYGVSLSNNPYSIERWQNTNVFPNLSPNEYCFYARVKENTEHYTGKISSAYKFFVPIEVNADAPLVDAMTLGVGGINGYSAVNGYTYIWLGTDKGQPVLWRVLDNKTNDHREEMQGLYLLSDRVIVEKTKYRNTLPSGTNEYAESTLKTTMTNMVYTMFNSNEQNALMPTYRTDYGITSPPNGTYLDGVKFVGTFNILNGDKLFVMSVEETLKAQYGFTTDESKIAYYNGIATGYWLRSVKEGGNKCAGAVSDLGHVGNVNITYPRGVRPAFNLDATKVLYSSIVDANISINGLNNTLQPISKTNKKDYKLTLLDENRTFKADIAEAITKAGQSVTIPYTGATVGYDNEYISVLLVDEKGAISHYSRVETPTDVNGTINVTIPSDIASGKYTLKVFSEQINEGRNTNYGSSFSDIALTVGDVISPTPHICHPILVSTPPSCDMAGIKDYYYCSDCGTYYEDAMCKVKIDDISVWKSTHVLDALGHDYGNVTYSWNGDVCTASAVCSRDSQHTDSESVRATLNIVDATCTTTGTKTYTAHFTRPWAQDRVRTETIPQKQHSYVDKYDATHHWKECTVCHNVIDKILHVFGDWIVNTGATCTAVGKAHRDCTCGYTEYKDIPMLEHNYVAKHDTTHHWKECTVCHKVIDRAPHDYGNVVYKWNAMHTELVATRQCMTCNNMSKAHAVVRGYESKKPTCTAYGTTTYVGVFSESWAIRQELSIDNIAPLGHLWNAVEYKWSNGYAECTATRICIHDSRHVDVASAVVKATITREPTANTVGQHTYVATFEEPWAESRTIVVDDIPSTGEWRLKEVVTPATCDNDGVVTYYESMAVPGKYFEDISAQREILDIDRWRSEHILPRLGHAWSTPQYVWDETGCTAYTHCTRDGSHVAQERVEFIVVTTPSTCTEHGNITRTATFVSEWAETQIKRETLPLLEHSYIAKHDTTHHWKECTVCHDVIDKTPHVFGDWIVDTDATCTTIGKAHRDCTCGYTEHKDIPMLEHSYIAKHDTTHHWKECTVCHDEIDKTPHVFGDWIVERQTTCRQDGRRYRECECGCRQYDHLDALPHQYIEKNDGVYKWRECSMCGKVVDRQRIPLSIMSENHTWQGGTEPVRMTITSGTVSRVIIDDIAIGKEYYVVENGVLTIDSIYMNTLKVGTHAVRIVADTGEAETTILIDEEIVHNQGDADNTAMIVGVSVGSVAILAVVGTVLGIVIVRRKRR